MKSNIISLVICTLLLGSYCIEAQTSVPSSREQRIMEEQRRRDQDAAFDRLKNISNGDSDNYSLNRENSKIAGKYNPKITKHDIQAISINPEDLKTFADFLKGSRTGILRLQNADVCSPENLIVQISLDCPNNIEGKATAYSFRTKVYVVPLLSDLFFKGDKFSTNGAFIFGIFSNLGDTDINSLSISSDGIKQLLEFEPSDKESEIQNEFQILRKGIQIGNHIYKRQVNYKENNTYVLRAIAYKGITTNRRLGAGKANILKGDTRKDVTVIFRTLRTEEDGSIILLWKELVRKPAPKIIWKEENAKIKSH